MHPASPPILFYLLAQAGPGEVCQDTLDGLRRSRQSNRYEEPAAAQLEAAGKLFAILFSRPESPGETDTLCAQLGLELLRVAAGEESFLVARERAGEQRGWGVYAFRRRDALPMAIQAPHSDDDVHTGRLAELLFLEGRAAAAAWNTASRRVKLKRTSELADLAHLPDSIFLAFTRAFAAAHPRGILLQVHGFDRTRRATDEGSKYEVILSDGTRSPPAWVVQIKHCLGEGLAVPAATYPLDIKELGALTNRQNQALRALGHRGFLHLELSPVVRGRLKDDAELRRALWRCVPEKQP